MLLAPEASVLLGWSSSASRQRARQQQPALRPHVMVHPTTQMQQQEQEQQLQNQEVRKW